MDNDRLHIFKSWMQYGGVDTKTKMFGGLDQKDLKDLDSEDILQARATSSIPEDRQFWKVDFEEVAKGFLSSSLADYFCIDNPPAIQKATNVLRNFLNYLLYHNVCPEYTENILAARDVVDTAEKELWLLHEADLWSPGDFNMACSTLFGGQYLNGYTGDADWRQERPDRIEIEGIRGLPDNIARKIVMFGIAGGATEEQALLFREKATTNSVEAARLEDGLLRFCFVGMKFTADIYELEGCGGIYYFDNVLGIYCSFYTVLNNGLLDGWKEPRPYIKATSNEDDMMDDDDEDNDDGPSTGEQEKNAFSNAQAATQDAMDAAIQNTAV
ncbi:Argonaute complex, subunit Arb1 [Ascosphaera apis ARSEF 7405]|uniref:Argonaute complex, subunit Arb1 n=1 Tax=Ascosphaera apis ARSEF 7405 TaxID=392613 RepID=A0A162I737_9EURO|nr:Argonaute complex, subunit Arb1 [Ascosphaera apis ARSEF 7405]